MCIRDSNFTLPVLFNRNETNNRKCEAEATKHENTKYKFLLLEQGSKFRLILSFHFYVLKNKLGKPVILVMKQSSKKGERETKDAKDDMEAKEESADS